MSCFDLHRKYPAACPHAVGLNASSMGTRLLSLSTIADAKISNPPWVNFQSAGWVSFQSAPTSTLILMNRLMVEQQKPQSVVMELKVEHGRISEVYAIASKA
jgi:hypothetical protein